MSEVDSKIHGQVLLLTINRPKAFNALTGEVIETLRQEVVNAASNPELRAVVITGSGSKAFCAGADLQELQNCGADAARQILASGQRAFRDIESADIPVIAAVNGLALGGGFELILASTIPVLAENAGLGLPESSLGLIPGYGGTQRLPRIVGKTVAAHLMLTGARLKADRAYALGVTPLPPVEGERVLVAALELAETISSQGPASVRAILSCLNLGISTPSNAGLAAETAMAALAVAGQESTEGIGAFLEKRPAQFESDVVSKDKGES